jgi:hypothetical protein
MTKARMTMVDRINPGLKVSPGGAILSAAVIGLFWKRAIGQHAQAGARASTLEHVTLRPLRDVLLGLATVSVVTASVDALRGAR